MAWMNLEYIHYAKGNKLDTERQILYDLNYTWNLKKLNSQKQSRMVVARDWGVRAMGGVVKKT